MTLTARQFNTAREAAFDAIRLGAPSAERIAELLDWPAELARRAVEALIAQQRVTRQTDRRLRAFDDGMPPLRVRRGLFPELYPDLPSPLLTVPAAAAASGEPADGKRVPSPQPPVPKRRRRRR